METIHQREMDAVSTAGQASRLNQAASALRRHWPEYLMEAGLLGTFMISACSFTVLLEHPASFARQAIASPFLRRLLTGLAMGLTAITLIYSPWGKQSGAHMNPATTLTFFRLGKVDAWDAVFYMLAQFTGGIIGVLVASTVLGKAVAHQSVRYAATLPMRGTGIAFLAEAFISFGLITLVLNASNSARLAHFTGIFAGALVATYITLEAPISGMSMNPARSFASAAPAGLWNMLWIYFTAPPLGMLMAAELYVRTRGTKRVFCAKYHHHNNRRCIFRCNFPSLLKEELRTQEAV
jgi:aquaporin Z